MQDSHSCALRSTFSRTWKATSGALCLGQFRNYDARNRIDDYGLLLNTATLCLRCNAWLSGRRESRLTSVPFGALNHFARRCAVLLTVTRRSRVQTVGAAGVHWIRHEVYAVARTAEALPPGELITTSSSDMKSVADSPHRILLPASPSQQPGVLDLTHRKKALRSSCASQDDSELA